MNVLNPLSKHWLQLNGCIREHILRTTKSPHRVVVNVQTKAVEAQENAHPVQVRNNRIPVTDYSIQQIVLVEHWIIITHHVNSRVSSMADNTERSNPHMGGKDGELCWVVCRQVRIRWHRVHMVSHDDGKRTEHRQVN